MSRRRSPSRLNLPISLWRDTFRAWEVGVTAPQVIAMRCLQMATAGPRPARRDRDELVRMGAEKFAAFSQAWAAMMLEGWFYPLRVGAALARSGPYGAAAVPLPNAFGQALAPVHRAVRANGRRLSRLRNAR